MPGKLSWSLPEDQDFYYEGLRDSTAGEELDASQAHAGCNEELEYMRCMKVWDRVLRTQVQGKVIGTRWVYVKKPNQVRCRLVAQDLPEARRGKTSTLAPRQWRRLSIFSPTPCQEALAPVAEGGNLWFWM